MILCYNAKCERKNHCARWRYRDHKRGGYCQMIFPSNNCGHFIHHTLVAVEKPSIQKHIHNGGNSKQRRQTRRAMEVKP